MIKALNEIEVVTLFVEDLAAAQEFYVGVFGLEVVYHDDESAVVRLGPMMLNLLRREQAPELVEPATVAGARSGVRALFTIRVANVDGVCAELEQHGVRLLNGPMDRPWRRRTAAFADPDGNVWEVAQILEGS
ncbi:Catechol 2,3-dioxygenase [Nonomuraea solani]|uniref:Catechol 2,3-dioxygenase n=1 Tax=Nonomuraea solani TaxID=1144553 RepID=A0A1H6EVA6_9ACTN|nr:VOC family protein [Nonomuraea solani]SEH01758.1 Catechol 2,3-dioxygenase [Nonomuraea solani]